MERSLFPNLLKYRLLCIYVSTLKNKIMNFPAYTVWIFALVLVLLAFLALYPTPLTIGLVVMLSSALIIFQAVLILKDESQ